MMKSWWQECEAETVSAPERPRGAMSKYNNKATMPIVLWPENPAMWHGAGAYPGVFILEI